MAIAAAWFGMALTLVQAREAAQLPDRAADIPSTQTAANPAGQHEGTARSLSRECSTKAFISELPHHYFEENQLHALILNDETDFERCLVEVERFLPHIDNWAIT